MLKILLKYITMHNNNEFMESCLLFDGLANLNLLNSIQLWQGVVSYTSYDKEQLKIISTSYICMKYLFHL